MCVCIKEENQTAVEKCSYICPGEVNGMKLLSYMSLNTFKDSLLMRAAIVLLQIYSSREVSKCDTQHF